MKKQMREESKGMTALCYTGFCLRMGRDYCGPSPLPLSSYLETRICRDLPLPAARVSSPLHSLFVTQKYKNSSVISRRKRNYFTTYVKINTSASWIPQTHLSLCSFSPPFPAWAGEVCTCFCAAGRLSWQWHRLLCSNPFPNLVREK